MTELARTRPESFFADRFNVTGGLLQRVRPHALLALAEPPLVTDLAKKLDLLRKVDGAARAADPRVKQVIASLTSEEVVTLVATASGWTVGDVRPLMRLNVTAIAEAGGKREIGAYGGGGGGAVGLFPPEGRRQRGAL